MKRALGLVLVVASAACSEPESGETEPVAPSFARIEHDILAPRCTFACHSGGEFAAGGLDLELDAHAALVDQPATAAACGGSGALRVVPGDAEASLLFAKIAAKADGSLPPCGEVMPPSGDDAPLTDDEIELVRAWIEAGASE